ncbi:NAD-dependent epimerase/dehydratase family protein [Nonomuraea sp. KC401]|uniref:NAD-dependent epimerase/dehydratase family protein n=1 Tax=unclassified Nonomuraea TaxID=2593643 RepID=UPI0010FE3BDB|nr:MULTISPECIES: NAD-dependent epimerase/dehydratase family protein [unclassified Nonomuraea]NBE94013.1 NAD-dependent epimerase/dehydratase family protein [Nonomuraea sp. K271]TLF74578.1 NAD-dependent epimerase/dehydratase family protein [Nonomuraea sp. KC401]
MRVVVVGATGNVGTSLVRALAADSGVSSIVGVARRLPGWRADSTDWRQADVASDDLVRIFDGADAVVHLAWLFQPTRDPATTWRANVLGSMRVFRAVAEAGVPALVHASSVGAYSPGAKDRPVDESWPTHGWPGAAYGREKAYVERVLDVFEHDHPGIRVVRMRPGFIFQRVAATEQRRLFGGPFVPRRLIRPGVIPFVPDIPGLRLQVLHARDAAEAFRLAVTKDVRGPFNLAAEPVLDPYDLAEMLGTRTVRVSSQMARAAVAAGWRLRLVPASPGLLELALSIPLMDVRRARDVLGWTPEYSSQEAMGELFRGLRDGAGMDTGPLAPDRGPVRRMRELATGVGGRP